MIFTGLSVLGCGVAPDITESTGMSSISEANTGTILPWVTEVGELVNW